MGHPISGVYGGPHPDPGVNDEPGPDIQEKGSTRF